MSVAITSSSLSAAGSALEKSTAVTTVIEVRPESPSDESVVAVTTASPHKKSPVRRVAHKIHVFFHGENCHGVDCDKHGFHTSGAAHGHHTPSKDTTTLEHTRPTAPSPKANSFASVSSSTLSVSTKSESIIKSIEEPAVTTVVVHTPLEDTVKDLASAITKTTIIPTPAASKTSRSPQTRISDEAESPAQINTQSNNNSVKTPIIEPINTPPTPTTPAVKSVRDSQSTLVSDDIVASGHGSTETAVDSISVIELDTPATITTVHDIQQNDLKHQESHDSSDPQQDAEKITEQQQLVEQQLALEQERIAIQERIAEQRQLAEKERILEQERVAEQARLAEPEQIAEQQQRVAKQERILEQERIAEQQRVLEQERIAEQGQIAEQQRLAAEQKRITEQEQAADEEADCKCDECEWHACIQERKESHAKKQDAESTTKVVYENSHQSTSSTTSSSQPQQTRNFWWLLKPLVLSGIVFSGVFGLNLGVEYFHRLCWSNAYCHHLFWPNMRYLSVGMGKGVYYY